MINMFQHDGQAIITGVWTAITAAKGFDPVLLNIPKEATHFVRYTTGATAALKLNETLTGGTSSATCKLIAQAVEVGTAGSGDTGVIFVSQISGVPTVTGETWTGAVSTGTVATIQSPIVLQAFGMPKAALIAIQTAAVNLTIGGVLPTTTAAQNYGIQLDAGQSMSLRGIPNIRTFKCINAVASNGAIVKYELYW